MLLRGANRMTYADGLFFLLTENEEFLAYFYTGLWKSRTTRRCTREVSIYLYPDSLGYC
jgi:L-amino acid N-acyltransferase YncA